MKKELLAVAMLLFAGGNLLAQPHVNDGTSYLMNQPLDMSTDFRDLSNTLFFADHLESFDAKSGEGLVNWKRGHLMPRQAFNTNGAQKAISQEINKMAKADVETQVYTEFNEQFQAVAWIILLLLLAEMLILERKNPLFRNIHLFSNKK
jgi:hypothetical protein